MSYEKKQSDKEKLKTTKNTIDVFASLTKAIDQAGGSVDIDELLEMNMLEFIHIICIPNGIRFFKKTDDAPQKTHDNNPSGYQPNLPD